MVITSVLSVGSEPKQAGIIKGRGRLGGSILGSDLISIQGNIDPYFEGYNVSSDEGFDLRNNRQNKFRNNARFGAGYGMRYR